jgi:hypothetical protein
MKVINEAAHLLTKEELIDWVVRWKKLSLGNRTGNKKKKTSKSCEERILSFSETAERGVI